MPRISERQEAITTVETIMLLDIFYCQSEDDENEGMVTFTLSDYVNLTSARYLNERNPVVRQPDRLHWLIHDLDERRFKQEARMTKRSFFRLLNRIKDHVEFTRSTRNPQKPVMLQLLVALGSLGMYGNGAAVGRIARSFGVSEGSVVNYTRRCITAILSLEGDVVAWPKSDEQRRISRRIRSESGFRDCIGFVDGTLFPFECQPEAGAEDYYSRKGRYGMSAMIVCDDEKRIRICYTGWPGCTHDARVYTNSPLGRRPEDFFADRAYILADSAYTPSSTVIPAFKKPANGDLSDEHKRFNYRLSNIRVRIEHCIGILKCRFPSLKGLRMRIDEDAGLRLASYWIRACIVLHNLLLDENMDDSWIEEAYADEEDEDEPWEESHTSSSSGAERREAIRADIL